MAYIQGNNKDAGTVSSTTLAFSSDITAGSQIIVPVRIGSVAVTVAVTDGKSNTYALEDSTTNAEGNTTQYLIYRASNCPATANATERTITVTLTGGTASVRMVIGEFGGLATSSPLHASESTYDTTPDHTSFDSGDGETTTEANCTLIGVLMCGNALEGLTAGTNYTHRQAAVKVAFESRDVTSTGTYDATYTNTADHLDSEMWMLAYKAAGEPPAGPTLPILMSTQRRFRL